MKSSRTPVVRSGEDLLALLPVLFGFQPTQSLAMVCVPPGPSVHARVDLGETAEEVAGALAELLEQAGRHGAARVILCVLTELTAAERWGEVVLDVLAHSQVEALAVIAADGDHWRPLGSGMVPQPYDVWSHPIVAQAVLEGRAILPDRQSLARLLDPLPEEVARVAARLEGGALPTTPDEVLDLVARHVPRSAGLGAQETALLLRSLRRRDVLEAVCSVLTRRNAEDHRELWTSVLRAAPPGWSAAPGLVLGMVAWLAGDGALAWCAVDRGRASGEPCHLLPWLEQVLEGAVHPGTWDGRAPAAPAPPTDVA